MTQLPPAGLHLIIDIETEENLSNVEAIRTGLEQAAQVCGATVLGCAIHRIAADLGWR